MSMQLRCQKFRHAIACNLVTICVYRIGRNCAAAASDARICRRPVEHHDAGMGDGDVSDYRFVL